jgi:glycerophosphoryl diester phosphodiesterase
VHRRLDPRSILATVLPVVALCLVVTVCFAAPAKSYRLIAHRGGVVEEKFPDNSASALKAAIARRYWMLEVDIRETKDGVLVMRHDADLKLDYGDPRKVFETTWGEIEKLRSSATGERIWRFDELVPAAKAAGLRLMLDSKDPHSSAGNSAP